MTKTVRIGSEHTVFAYDKKSAPAARVASGDIVIFETLDALCGRAQNESLGTFCETYEDMDARDPITGPVYVEGAVEGGCIKLDILRIGTGARGFTTIRSGEGLLEDILGTLQQPLKNETRFCDIKDGKAAFCLENGKEIAVPVKPFVANFGVAPKFDRRCSYYQGPEWCGNASVASAVEGVSIVLPVAVDGAYLCMGGVFAAQGSASVTGRALSCAGEVEVRVSAGSREDFGFVKCSQINSPDWIGSIGQPSCADATAAMRFAYADLVNRLVVYYGMSKADAYMLLGLAGVAEQGSATSCLCRIDRALLK